MAGIVLLITFIMPKEGVVWEGLGPLMERSVWAISERSLRKLRKQYLQQELEE